MKARFALLALSVVALPAQDSFLPLKARPLWKPDPNLPLRTVDWEPILANPEIRFLTDNQLSVSVSKEPGLSRIHYFPVRRRPRLVGKLDWGAVQRENQFVGSLPFRFRDRAGNNVTLQETEYRWWPHRIERRWKNEQYEIHEELAVKGNVAALRLTQTRGEALVADVSGRFDSAGDLGISVARLPSEDRISLKSPITWRVALGYRSEDVTADLRTDVFTQARHMWDYYFRAMVPRLDSSDANLVRLYYYLFYVVRSSLYDVPWEPYTNAYTCPWKTSAIWQWAWNTGFNAITERWLNDPSLAQEGMKLIARNGGALNVGAYLHPLRRLQQLPSVYDWADAVDAAQKHLDTPDYDHLFLQPYTVPNSFLGVWEVYLMTGDREFLRTNLPLLEDYERIARSHGRDGSPLSPFQFMYDEFDYSLRWKPVQQTFTKGGLQRSFDVPVNMIDFNVYLLELRRILARSYRELGAPVRAQQMESLAARTAEEINGRLWDPRLRFYSDARADNSQSTGVRAVSGFAPLYAGIVPPDRKEALMEALDDPQGFAAPHGIPSIEVRHPDLDPNLLTYGGDVLMTTGVWTVSVALANNGEAHRVTRLLRRAIDLVTKDGVSSSYSYNSLTGSPNQRKHTLSTQCAILNDLICRYVVGFTPRADTVFEFNPIALDPALSRLKFGPFRYKGKYWIEVEWTGKEYIVSVNGAALRFPTPRHVLAQLSADGKLQLVRETR